MRYLLISLFIAAALSGQTFYPDDPVLVEPEPMVLDEVAFRKLNDYFDLLSHQFGEPGEQQPKPKDGEAIRALSANTIDEVPDSKGWFTNRMGARPMTPEQAAVGPGEDHAPAEQGLWTIVGAKTEGVTPGFRITDANGNRYLLKFDPLTNPEMGTAADMIGSRVFYALGYNTPENYLVNFRREKLTIADGADMPDDKGHRRPISRTDVNTALAKVPRNADGSIRAIASRYLRGKVIGEFRYFGTRSDDYNDTIPHEHRRELRGLFVFAAWLNHNDSRAINDLDTLIEEDGQRYVRHHLIDFGAILGSASVLSNTARDGNAYFFEFGPAMAQVLTLGAYVPRWARSKYHKSTAVGMANYDDFDPERWKPNYPNPAFRNRLPDDTFWAAKKVMAFTDEHLREIVKRAQYSDPRDTEWTLTYLRERRDRIGRKYLTQVLPLDNFAMKNDELVYEDLAVKYAIVNEGSYVVEWSRFDNATGEYTPIPGTDGLTAPPSSDEYLAAKITLPSDPRFVLIHIRNRSEVVGVQRFW